jgi:hypothetical protein
MNPPGREPREFDDVFRSYNGLPIVGGQAVNLWADSYHLREPLLGEFHPFISKDADLFGQRPELDAIAPPPGWQILFYPEVRQSAVALLTKALPDGSELRAEVMRAVHGISARELAGAELVEIRPGHIYRLPSPLRLLKAKIANVHDLAHRERPQDLRHVRMLVLVCGHYLRDLHASVLAGATPERALINALHELVALLATPKARAIAAKHGVKLGPALPCDLPVERMPKLAAFYANLAAVSRPP